MNVFWSVSVIDSRVLMELSDHVQFREIKIFLTGFNKCLTRETLEMVIQILVRIRNNRIYKNNTTHSLKKI